jgi:hypothetical protein
MAYESIGQGRQKEASQTCFPLAFSHLLHNFAKKHHDLLKNHIISQNINHTETAIASKRTKQCFI